MDVDVNYVAVILAVVVSMVVGFLWYSPFLFGKQWQKLHGWSDADLKGKQKEAGKAYAMSAIFALITAYMLVHVMALSENFYHYSAMKTGLTSAFSMWLGFVMPVQATHTLFSEDKKWNLFLIDTGFQLVSLLAMAKVLALL